MDVRGITLICLVFVLSCCTLSERNGKGNPQIHFSMNAVSLKQPVSLLAINGNYQLFVAAQNETSKEQLFFSETDDLLEWNKQICEVSTGLDIQYEKGTIVNDTQNSSGFSNSDSLLVGIFPIGEDKKHTSHTNSQTLALIHSNDGGHHWSTGNQRIILPNIYSLIKHVKLIWHDETQRWIMLVLDEYEIRFYASENLKDWEYLSSFGEQVFVKMGRWTKLDFFSIESEETNEIKWILFISTDQGSPNDGSGIQYFVGDFDGYIFRATRDKPKWLDNGTDNYQGLVLTNYALIGEYPYYLGCIYNSKHSMSMEDDAFVELTTPRCLRLSNAYDGWSIMSTPVSSFNNVEDDKKLIDEAEFSGELKIKKKLPFPCEINLEYDLNNRLYLDMAKVFGIKISDTANNQLAIGYHIQKGYFFILDPTKSYTKSSEYDDFYYAPYVSGKETMDLKIILDKNSLEVFAMKGLISLTRKYSFNGSDVQLSLYTEGGRITLEKGNVSELESID